MNDDEATNETEKPAESSVDAARKGLRKINSLKPGVYKGAKPGKEYTQAYLDRIEKQAGKILGEHHSAEDIAALVGAPEDSITSYFVNSDDEIKVRVKHPDIEEMN